MVVEGRPGRAGRPGVDRRLQRQLLGSLEAGTRDRGAQARQWVHRQPGRVATKGQVRSRGAQASRRPAERRPFWSHGFRPVHYAAPGRMQRQHRRNDAERAEARHVLGVHHRDVLDAVPRRFRCVGRLGDGAKGVEREPGRAVARGVHGNLPAPRVEHRDQLRQVRCRHPEVAPGGAPGRVRFDHRGGLRCHGAIERDRRETGLEQGIVGITLRDRVEILRRRPGGRHGGVDPQREGSGITCRVVEVEVTGRRADILHARDPTPLGLADGRLERVRPVFPGRLRQRFFSERHRGAFEQPGRLAAAVSDDDAVHGVRRAPGDMRGGERLGIQPERLPVLREQLHRAIADRGIELGARRLIGEQVV